MLRKLERVIVVEDDATLRAAITRGVRSWGTSVTEAGTAAEAKALLANGELPDLAIIDVRLPDESVFEILDVIAELSPAPMVVVMSGKASPQEAFRLAQLGVRAYLAKPISTEDLATAVDSARREAPTLEPLISASVGHVPMREMQRSVRRVMVKEALAQADGNRSGAARLLEVSRQAVQQIVRDQDPEDEAPLGTSPVAHGEQPPALAFSKRTAS